MIFRRRRPKPATPWPSQGLAFWLGQQIGRATNHMAGWTRMQRASIVLVGMALAIPLFWLDRPGWAVGIGFVSLSLFWLSIPAETPPESTELDDQPKD